MLLSASPKEANGQPIKTKKHSLKDGKTEEGNINGFLPKKSHTGHPTLCL